MKDSQGHAERRVGLGSSGPDEPSSAGGGCWPLWASQLVLKAQQRLPPGLSRVWSCCQAAGTPRLAHSGQRAQITPRLCVLTDPPQGEGSGHLRGRSRWTSGTVPAPDRRADRLPRGSESPPVVSPKPSGVGEASCVGGGGDRRQVFKGTLPTCSRNDLWPSTARRCRAAALGSPARPPLPCRELLWLLASPCGHRKCRVLRSRTVSGKREHSDRPATSAPLRRAPSPARGSGEQAHPGRGQEERAGGQAPRAG